MALVLECVTPEENLHIRQFCLTDCGPSEGCNPDDYRPEDYKSSK